jgi:hypothetical protein
MATKKTVVDSNETETAQPADRDFDGLYIPEPAEIEIVAAPTGGGGDKKQFDELKFNEDVLEIMVHESTDPNAENPVFTGCNGVNQYFFRGQPQQVKRKYVAILASCKEHSIATQEYTQSDGSRAVRIGRTSSLKYPFSVISDPAGKRGADWLRSLLQAPT